MNQNNTEKLLVLLALQTTKFTTDKTKRQMEGWKDGRMEVRKERLKDGSREGKQNMCSAMSDHTEVSLALQFHPD